MGRKKIALLFFFLSGMISFGQKLIFEEYPQKILDPPVYGIKGKHFLHFFNEVNLLLGAGGADTLKTQPFLSSGYAFGLRYNLKLAKKIYWINDLSYRINSFNIKQKNNRFPDTLSYKKEKLNLNQLCFSTALRWVYSKKKRYFGKHVDIGATVAWNFSTSHYMKTEVTNSDPAFGKQISRVRQKNLSYINPLEINPFIAFGFEKMQLKFQYRLTDIFSEYKGAKLPELPRFIIGLNFKFVSLVSPDNW